MAQSGAKPVHHSGCPPAGAKTLNYRLAHEPGTLPFVIFYRVRRVLARSISGVAALLAGVILYGTVTEYLLERGAPGSGVRTLFDSLWFVVQTITTVGYGDTPVVTFWGRVNAIFLMLVGIGTLGLFTASFASTLIDRGARRRSGERSVRMSGHVVICNWNPSAGALVKEVLSEKPQVVVLAPLQKSPHPGVEFVSGSCLHAADLSRAGVQGAESVIILPSPETPDEPPSGVDAKTILGAMNVRRLSPGAHVVVELLLEDSVENAKSAGVDESVVRGTVTAKLLSRGALDPGTIDVVQTILTGNSGEELFEDPVPSWAVGRTYAELAKRISEAGAVAIAVRTKEGLRVNPPPSATLSEGSVAYLARKRVSTD